MKMIEDEELIAIDYRVEFIFHIGNGSVSIDSMTTLDFDDFNDTISFVIEIAEKYCEEMLKTYGDKLNMVTDINDEDAYISLYRGVVPVCHYAVNPLKIYRNYSEYRSFRMVVNDDDTFSILSNHLDNKLVTITNKNTIDECVMYIDSLLHDSVNFIDSTFDTIEGSKLWIPKQESNTKFKKKTAFLMS